jgi:hypothetical protein
MRPGSSRGRRRASEAAALGAVSSRRTPPRVSSARRRCSRQMAWVRRATNSSRRSDSSRGVTGRRWGRPPGARRRPGRRVRSTRRRRGRSSCRGPGRTPALEPPAWRARRPPVRRRPRAAGPGNGPPRGSPPPPSGASASEPRTAVAVFGVRKRAPSITVRVVGSNTASVLLASCGSTLMRTSSIAFLLHTHRMP